MLWSLLKIALFIAAVALATFGAGFLIENGGEILIATGTTEFTLTPFGLAVVVVVLLVALWLTLKLLGLAIATLRFLNGDETAISRYFDRSRERRGFAALADGMVALASGEYKAAMANAAKAERLLKRPELTTLLTAQAAEASGDRAKATEAYKKLLTEDRTRFVGVHGLMKQKLADGDTDTALKLAEKAFALRPRHEGTLNTLFRLQSDKADWGGARKTLASKLRAGQLPRQVHTRRDAVLALAEARTLADRGDQAGADALAIEANRHSPGLVPAAVMAAAANKRKGNIRAAAALLRKAWTQSPHPELAAAYAALVDDETPAARRKRFAPLLKIAPDHPETRLAEAELALAAEDYPAARKAMGSLATDHPSIRAFTVMAAIEKGEGAPETVVRAWLARAVNAPRGPQWICDNCHHIHAQWTPACENCAAIDTLSWSEPPKEAADGATTALPPHVAGLLAEDPTPEPPASPEPADTVEDADTEDPRIGASDAARDVTPAPEADAQETAADARK